MFRVSLKSLKSVNDTQILPLYIDLRVFSKVEKFKLHAFEHLNNVLRVFTKNEKIE